MPGTLESLFRELDDSGIAYCLPRDADRIGELEQGGEVDCLVDPRDLPALVALLERRGFLRLPAWGHAPHRFYVYYDAHTDAWFKWDIVTDVAYGRPVHTLRTDLAAPCLAGRRRLGPVFAPSPEHELLMLLLHCVIDKGQFSPSRRARVKALRAQVASPSSLSELLGRYWHPGATWEEIANTIDREAWDALLGSRARILATLGRREPLATKLRATRDRVLRKLRRLVGLLDPAAPSVALLAPDGAGKSTLTETIRERAVVPVAVVYMGLFQQRRRPAWSRVPGLGLAGHLATQWLRYAKARMQQAQGRLVLFDRYTYDALLPSRQPANAARRLRRWLLAHACPSPDVAIVLDAPGAVLHARKQEHSAAALEEQRQAYLRIAAALARGAVVDATADPDAVRRAVTELVWRAYRRRLSTTRT